MLDDRITVRTPEGVDLELTLAGAGSRMAAAVIDGIAQIAVVLVALVVLAGLGAAVGEDAALLLLGIASLTITVIIIGYYVLFEVLAGGRTPGKMAMGIRVVSTEGGPVTLSGSMVRNLIRIVDFLPSFYGVGLISVLATGKNQRLGDLAARTVVVRDRQSEVGDLVDLTVEPVAAARWDVSAVTSDEVALVRRYLSRRRSLTPDRRDQIAGQIAGKLRPKVGGVEGVLSDEEFLERLLGEKLARER